MINGVKITLIISLTILVACVLFISYNEYINRYSIVVANDNSLFIFDKKSTVLNKCGSKGCEIIETKLPSRTYFGLDHNASQSKMFGITKNLPESVNAKPATSDNKRPSKVVTRPGSIRPRSAAGEPKTAEQDQSDEFVK
ncbi:MAG: hypothetical protein LBF70_02180 [Holosporales bacterium]|jgi:hypothetical protein|nr:hypothetical protein [Holosporales bacterium]